MVIRKSVSNGTIRATIETQCAYKKCGAEFETSVRLTLSTSRDGCCDSCTYVVTELTAEFNCPSCGKPLEYATTHAE